MRFFFWNLFHKRVKKVPVKVTITTDSHKVTRTVQFKVRSRHSHRRTI